jgi:hypothetical protein
MMSFALFPRGYMPVRTTHGFTITLCSAAGLVTRLADGPAEAPRRHVGSEKCDLVGAGAAILPQSTLFVTPFLAPAAMSLWSVRHFALRFRSAFDPNAPPTAPPIHQ